jgi:hypothetical protein
MRKWLEENEPYMRLAYRLVVVWLLLWLGQLIARADMGWYLSAILRLLESR